MGKEWSPNWVRTGENILWLDDDHAVSFIVPNGTPIGGAMLHRKDPTEDSFTFCAAAFYWDQMPESYHHPVTVLWRLVSMHPLTITPSILCGCGHHGFIRDDTWIQA